VTVWRRSTTAEAAASVVADETAKDARTAHVVLYHDAEHPSALEIPIVPATSPK